MAVIIAEGAPMLTKIVVTLLVFLTIWLVFFRRPKPRRRSGPDRKALPHPLQLARCPRCGTWRLPESPCACTRGDDS
jgi:ribosomal protein L32